MGARKTEKHQSERGPNQAGRHSNDRKPRLPEPRPGEYYLTGPIPMRWVRRATRLPGKAWQLGCALWFEALCSKNRSPVVILQRRKREWFGLERRAFYRALEALQKAKLIRVEPRRGKAPEITILDVPMGAPRG